MRSDFSTTTTTTWDTSHQSSLLMIKREVDGSWIVAENATSVWGHGRSLLEAMCDFWAALFSHIGTLDGERLTPRLERQLVAMKQLVETQAPNTDTKP